MTLGFYSEGDAKRIKQFVDSFGDDDVASNTHYKKYKKPKWYYVRLLSDLPSAEESLEGYTQAQARVSKYLNDEDNLHMVEATNAELDVTITNRSTTVSFSEDDRVWVRRIEAEYVPFSGASGGGVFARGSITSVDCPNAAVTVAVSWMSFCGEVPDEEYGEIEVQDPYGFTGWLTEDELLNADPVRVEYVYGLNQDCQAQWDLTMVSVSNICGY